MHHGAWFPCPSSRCIPFRDCIARLPEAPSRAAWHHVAQSRKAFSRSEGTGQQAFDVYGCLLLWARCARCDVRPGREWADGLRHVIAIAYLACGRGGTTLAKACAERERSCRFLRKLQRSVTTKGICEENERVASGARSRAKPCCSHSATAWFLF